MKLDKLKLGILMAGTTVLGITLWAAAPGSGVQTPAPSRAVAPVNTATVETRQDVVVPTGTTMRVRLNSGVSTRSSRPGDRFSGTLVSPVAVSNSVILPVGTSVGGSIIESAPSGRLKGRAVLSLRLNTVSLNGRTLHVSTASDTRVSTGHKKRNFAWIGGGTGGGLLIGALAGGPVGAAIGAGSGAAAGLAGAAITGKKQVSLPVESELTFRLSRPLTVPDRS